MKLPLWVKDRDGKWHRFPYEALTQLPDGKYGIANHVSHNDLSGVESLLTFTDLCEATGWDINHFFDYDVAMDAFILKDKAGEET